MAASMEHEKKENKVIKSVPKQSNEKRLIVVLERASLESVKVCNVFRIRFSCQLEQRTMQFELSLCLMFLFQVGKQFELLNCDKHKGLAKKFKRDISLCRPDITHQVNYKFVDHQHAVRLYNIFSLGCGYKFYSNFQVIS